MSNYRQLPTDIEALAEVEAGNRIRKQSGLPLVEPQKELDRLHQVREHRAFEQWMQSRLRYRVEQKLLMRVRRQRNNLTWTPTGFLSGGGWAFHTVLVKQMRKLRERLVGSSLNS
jgi:hypothetical protein